MTGWWPVVVGLGWAGVVVGSAWTRRPRPVRRPGGAGGGGGRSGGVARLGGALRRAVGLRPDTGADRAVGWAVVASVALLALAPPLAPLPGLVAATASPLAARRARRREVEGWEAVVPEVVDLFRLALGAGLAVPGALALVAPRAPPPLGPALERAELRFRHGEALDRALARVVATAPATRSLVAVLVAAHCDGVPASEPLARLATEVRTARRRRAEARARQVPVKMLFPLVGCTLPAFVLVTVVPAVVSALGGLPP